ncbi:hypothetical protein MCOR30_002405 [Pyricularia oryzae]|nr:hypothetical protein MCOR30_002405 [Pyricularia oryzae]
MKVELKASQAERAAQLQKPSKGYFFFGNKEYPRVKWWTRPNMRKLYFYCFVLIFVNIANGFDGSMMNSLQSLPYWQRFFGYPEGVTLGLLGSAMSLGSLITMGTVPWVCDTLGRKKGVIIGSVMTIIGVVLQSSAPNYNAFLASRFIIGAGMTLSTNAGPLLCAEIAFPQDRAIITTFMGCSYAVGSFVAAWTTFGTLKIESDWAWRLPSLLQAWATLIVFAVIWWIPDSPRYWIARDQDEKAIEVLAKYHAEGDRDDPFVQLEFREIRAAFDLDRMNQTNTRWSDLYSTKGNRHRMSLVIALAVFAQWSGNGIIAYYLKLVLDSVDIKSPSDQLGINGGSKAMSLLVNLVVAFYIDKLGRRPILMISTLGMTICFIIWTILSAQHDLGGRSNPNLGRGVVAVMYMYNFSYNLKTGMPMTYTIEIMPFGLRAKAAMIGGFITMAAVFFNQFINPIALKALAWRYYIVYCVFLGFEVWFIYFFVVETRYVPIEEIAKFFDGEQNDVLAATNAADKLHRVESGVIENENVENANNNTTNTRRAPEVKDG